MNFLFYTGLYQILKSFRIAQSNSLETDLIENPSSNWSRIRASFALIIWWVITKIQLPPQITWTPLRGAVLSQATLSWVESPLYCVNLHFHHYWLYMQLCYTHTKQTNKQWGTQSMGHANMCGWRTIYCICEHVCVSRRLTESGLVHKCVCLLCFCII